MVKTEMNKLIKIWGFLVTSNGSSRPFPSAIQISATKLTLKQYTIVLQISPTLVNKSYHHPKRLLQLSWQPQQITKRSEDSLSLWKFHTRKYHKLHQQDTLFVAFAFEMQEISKKTSLKGSPVRYQFPNKTEELPGILIVPVDSPCATNF